MATDSLRTFTFVLFLIVAVTPAPAEQTAGPQGFLGVSLEQVSTAMRAALALEEGRGVLVRRVVPGSAAEEAGLAAGDVIVQLQGRPVRGPRELARTVGSIVPGEALDLEVWRGGQLLALQAVLMERPDGAQQPKAARQDNRPDRLGLSLMPLTDQLSAYFGAPGGILVSRVEQGRAGEIAGLQAGDIIVATGETEIRSPQQLAQILARSKEPTVLLAVVRNGNDIYIRVALE
jgi:serine protease Do